jgi:competence protein ComFC
MMKFFQNLINRIREFSSRNGYVCDGCGAEIFTYPQNRLCEDCEGKLYKNDRGVCEKCGRQTVAQGVCLSCKKRLPKYTKGISPFVYKGETAAFVNRVKNGKRRLAYFFAEYMTQTLLQRCEGMKTFYVGDMSALNENVKENVAVKTMWIVPVPMTEQAEKNRGFNQATELAAAIEKELQQKGYAVKLREDILQKRRETKMQKHMDYESRIQNVEGAYHVHKRSDCKGATVLLVDDIMTTGATGNECAERLFGAGAKEVIFLTAAALPERK